MELGGLKPPRKERDMMKEKLNLNWYVSGTTAIGANPPLPVNRCEIGKDKDGKMWICEASYFEHKGKFLVKFDYDDGKETPFLREKVLDASIYWDAVKEVYHAKFVEYNKIQDVIREFIAENDIREA